MLLSGYVFRFRFVVLSGFKNGGEGEIRTLVTCYGKHAFEACGFNHSPTSPLTFEVELIGYHKPRPPLKGIKYYRAALNCSAVIL